MMYDQEGASESKWKVEPLSPPFIGLDSDPDNCWLFEDDLAQQSVLPSEEKFDQQLSRSEVASKLLDDLDDLEEIIKEEPFSVWLEEKIDLPIFEELPVDGSPVYDQFSKGNEAVKESSLVEDLKTEQTAPEDLGTSNDTQTLLQEFESVYEEVELHNGTLTPPQSPVLPSYPNILTQDVNGSPLLITPLQQVVPVQDYTSRPNQPQISIPPEGSIISIPYRERRDALLPNLEQMVPSTPVPDVAQELAVVDELVRSRVEDLESEGIVNNGWENTTYSNASSPEYNSVNGSVEYVIPHVTPLSPSSTSSSSFSSSDDDPEWIPTTTAPGSYRSSGRKHSSKPYSRQEEKRQRKKEQNKNAATRYRMKKKAEIEEIVSEEKDLTDRNKELQQNVSDLQREIKYLKGLMREVFRAKGLVK